MWSKKDAHITERRKKFQPEKVQNWRCGIHIEKKKKLKLHFRDPEKPFSISYFKVFLHAVSTYCKL